MKLGRRSYGPRYVDRLSDLSSHRQALYIDSAARGFVSVRTLRGLITLRVAVRRRAEGQHQHHRVLILWGSGRPTVREARPSARCGRATGQRRAGSRTPRLQIRRIDRDKEKTGSAPASSEIGPRLGGRTSPGGGCVRIRGECRPLNQCANSTNEIRWVEIRPPEKRRRAALWGNNAPSRAGSFSTASQPDRDSSDQPHYCGENAGSTAQSTSPATGRRAPQ